MAINKNLNTRIDITLPNSQYDWVERNSKKLGISKSKFISWILARRIKQIIEELKVTNAPTQEIRNECIDNDIYNMPQDEYERYVQAMLSDFQSINKK